MVEARNESGAQISAPSTAPRIVVCCDGSWCGDGTDTTSNVEIFAAAFAGVDADKGIKSMRSTGNKHYYNFGNQAAVAYFDGVGTNGSIVDYLLNGALALDIKELCVEAYLFIVKQYNPSAWDNLGSQVLGSQIYLIGLSRGAYTVRMVASMINKLGILRRDKYRTEGDLKTACEQVYDMHASDDERYSSNSDTCVEFRRVKSHATPRPPIKFMGLFDTVGDLGVPFINAGDRLRYGTAKQFYDQNVSAEVECVYQALALTDRMSLFTPCYVDRSDEVINRRGRYKDVKDLQYITEQRWFPGSHYDIGRQRFVLLRSNDSLIEALGRWGIQMFNLLKLNITYTKVLADPPFEYLVRALRVVDPGALNQDGAWYIAKYNKDDLPPTWKVLWFKPLDIDAYDGIADAEGSQAFLARLVRWSVKTAIRYLVPGLSLTIRAIKGAVELIVTKQVLVDRHVPLWFSPNDFGNRDYLRRCNGRTYKSRALDRYLLMRLQEHEPPPVPMAAAEGANAAGQVLQGIHAPAQLPPTEGHPMPPPVSIAAEHAGASVHSVQAPSVSTDSLPATSSKAHAEEDDAAGSPPRHSHTSPSAPSNAAAAHTSPSAAGASAHPVGTPATSNVLDGENGHGGVAKSKGESSEARQGQDGGKEEVVPV